jgi:4-diphosphocytidyl-2-C-methyl-D-erythritol kinase
VTGGGVLRDTAPAKINLCLLLGPTRPEDGRHELVTVFQPLTLADRVTLEPGGLGAAADVVACDGVDGDNLALAALRAFRARTGWAGAPVRLVIDKRIPVAAGMAGGSADAAAALRLAARAAGVGDDDLLRDIGAGLGADVPAQVRPRPCLADGAGDRVVRVLADPPPFGALLLPARTPLATADVFREADRRGLARDPGELAGARATLERALGPGPLHGLAPGLLVNDLEPAARALSHEVAQGLDELRALGADHAMVCGSGPTVAGLYADPLSARAAAARLEGRTPAPVVAEPWRAAA